MSLITVIADFTTSKRAIKPKLPSKLRQQKTYPQIQVKLISFSQNGLMVHYINHLGTYLLDSPSGTYVVKRFQSQLTDPSYYYELFYTLTNLIIDQYHHQNKAAQTTYSVTLCDEDFFKWANPGPFSFIFSLFKQAIQYFTTNQC